MDDVIYTGQLTDVNPLIAQINWQPKNTLMILERFQNQWLEKDEREKAVRFEPFSSAEDFSLFQTGRIFDPEKELFWAWNDNHRFHMIYSGIKADLPQLQAQDTTNWECSEQKYLLWGRSLENNSVFLELQIPRLLRYPLACNKNTTRPALKLIVYGDQRTCQIQHFRFCGLEETE